jgi:TIR domain
MAKIFISYRRNDSAYIAAMVNEKVQHHFGPNSVFFDIDAIPLGVDFRKHIGDAVGQCDVLLLIIGDHWMEQSDDRGHRRLDDPGDYVRIEIESALKRNIPVIPVLVGEAMMPSPNDLPAPIQDIVFRNAAEIRAGSNLRQHLDRLIRDLETKCRSGLSEDGVQSKTISTRDDNLPRSAGSDVDLAAALYVIKTLLTGYVDPHLHLAPVIPPDKLKNAIDKYAYKLDQRDVLLLYDNTYFGGAKEGFCLTLKEIYWHNWLQEPGHILYSQIERARRSYCVDTGPSLFRLFASCIVINGQKIPIMRGRGKKILIYSIVNIILTLRDKTNRRDKASG